MKNYIEKFECDLNADGRVVYQVNFVEGFIFTKSLRNMRTVKKYGRAGIINSVIRKLLFIYSLVLTFVASFIFVKSGNIIDVYLIYEDRLKDVEYRKINFLEREIIFT